MAVTKYPRVRSEYVVRIGTGGDFATIQQFLSGMACDIRSGSTQVLAIDDLVGAFTAGQVVEGQYSHARGTVKHATPTQILLTGVGQGEGHFIPGEPLKVYQGGSTPSCTLHDAGRLATIVGLYLDTDILAGDLTIPATGWITGATGAEPPGEVILRPLEGCQSTGRWNGKRIDGTLTIQLPFFRIEGVAVGGLSGGIIVDTATAGSGRVVIGSCFVPQKEGEANEHHGVLVRSGSTAHIWGTTLAGWSGSGIFIESGGKAYVRHCTTVRNSGWGIANYGECYVRASLCYQDVGGGIYNATVGQNNVVVWPMEQENYGFILNGANARDWVCRYTSAIHSITNENHKVYMKAMQIEEGTDNAGLYYPRDIAWRAKPMATPDRSTPGPADIGADDYHVDLSFAQANQELDEWNRAYGDLQVSASGNDRKFRVTENHEFPRTGFVFMTSDTHISLGGKKITFGRNSAGAQKDTGRGSHAIRVFFPRPCFLDTVNEELLVAMPAAKRIYCIDPADTPSGYRHKWEIGNNPFDVQLTTPWGVTADSEYIYIADLGAGAVYKVYRSGTGRGQLVSGGNTWDGAGTGTTIEPTGVHVNGGYLYVSDFRNSKIHILSAADMTYVTSYGMRGYGSEPGTFDGPISLVGRGTRLYVVDWGSYYGSGFDSRTYGRASVLEVNGQTITWVAATERVSQRYFVGAWGNGTHLFLARWRGTGGNEGTEVYRYNESDGQFIEIITVRHLDGSNTETSTATGICGSGSTLWVGQYYRYLEFTKNDVLAKVDVSGAPQTTVEFGAVGPTGAAVCGFHSTSSWGRAFISDIPLARLPSSTPSDVTVYDGEIELDARSGGWHTFFSGGGNYAAHDLICRQKAYYAHGFATWGAKSRLERVYVLSETGSFIEDEARRQGYFGLINFYHDANGYHARVRDLVIEGAPFFGVKADTSSPSALTSPCYDIRRIFCRASSFILLCPAWQGEDPPTVRFSQTNTFPIWARMSGEVHDYECAGLTEGGLSMRGGSANGPVIQISRIRSIYRGRMSIPSYHSKGIDLYEGSSPKELWDAYIFGFHGPGEGHCRGLLPLWVGQDVNGGNVTVRDVDATVRFQAGIVQGNTFGVTRGHAGVVVRDCNFISDRAVFYIASTLRQPTQYSTIQDCTFTKRTTDGYTLSDGWIGSGESVLLDFKRCRWYSYADPLEVSPFGGSGIGRLRHHQKVKIRVLNGGAPVQGALVTFSSTVTDPDFIPFPEGYTNQYGYYEPELHTQLWKRDPGVATSLDRDPISVHASKSGVGEADGVLPQTRYGAREGEIYLELDLAGSPPPTVGSVHPASGPTAGGQQNVKIYGANFDADCTVTFGGADAQVTAWSSNVLTVTTPAHSAGLVTVTVTNPGVGSGSLADAYEYLTLSSKITDDLDDPQHGGWIEVPNNTAVTVQQFNDAGDYAFYGKDSDGPDQSAGRHIYLSRATQDMPTNPQSITIYGRNTQTSGAYYAVAALFRAYGTVWGNDFRCYRIVLAGREPNYWHYIYFERVNTDGSYFTFATHTTGVMLPTEWRIEASVTGTGLHCTFVIDIFDSWTASLPILSVTKDGPGSSPVYNDGVVGWAFPNRTSATITHERVRFNKIEFPGFGTYPIISSISPSSGSTAGGTQVTISGTDFGTTRGTGSVYFGANEATSYVSWSQTSVVCVTPAGNAGPVDVKLTRGDGWYDKLPSGFTYVPEGGPPVVNSVSPSSGPETGHTFCTIYGSGFQTGALVHFGGQPATYIEVVNEGTITCFNPAHTPGPVTVRVTNPDNQYGELPDGFTYISAPTITQIYPNLGPTSGGTLVTITGTGFQSQATVKFRDSYATDVVVISSQTIQCKTPPNSAGPATVTVTNPDTGQGSLPNGFTYFVPVTVTSVDPDRGPVTGNTPVSIYGSGFESGATVRFDTSNASGVVVESSTKINCLTPAHSAGWVTVTVSNPGGGEGSLPNGYKYISAVTVSSVTPDFGPVDGGTLVNIAGSGFQAGASVTFDGIPAFEIVVVSPTSITCRTPAHPPGPASIRVTNPDEGYGELVNGFVYIGEASGELLSISAIVSVRRVRSAEQSGGEKIKGVGKPSTLRDLSDLATMLPTELQNEMRAKIRRPRRNA